jgi:uncharacterized protein YecE (DUF72 family)
MAMTRIGISGWRYEPWRKVFYPPDLNQSRELAFASRAFSTIEINGSFYSLQTPKSYAAWHDATPDGFVFSVKGPRYITHLLRLKDVEKPLANFFASGVFELREKLGPLLWQFPPSLRLDENRFDSFFTMLPRDTRQALRLARKRDARMHGRSSLKIDVERPLRHAVEIRHESFVTPAFVRLLKKHRIALVVADTAGKWPLVEELTADFMYVRLHGDKELYASGYTDAALDHWAARIRRWSRRRDVFCYFDNDIKVRAPFDADRLREKLGVARAQPDFEFPDRAALRTIRPVRPLPPFRWRRIVRVPGRRPAARRVKRAKRARRATPARSHRSR